jgi:hypothetical protein
MTEPYSKTNAKFDALLRKMGELHDAKNAGYAVAEDPLHNFRACEKFGIPMYQGIAVRISDKQSRWQNLVGDATKDQVGETLEDTTMDEAVYLLLFLIALDEYKRLTPPMPQKPGNRWTNRDPYTTGRANTSIENIYYRKGMESTSACCQDGLSEEQRAIQTAGVPVAVVPRGPLNGDSFYGAKKG